MALLRPWAVGGRGVLGWLRAGAMVAFSRPCCALVPSVVAAVFSVLGWLRPAATVAFSWPCCACGPSVVVAVACCSLRHNFNRGSICVICAFQFLFVISIYE